MASKKNRHESSKGSCIANNTLHDQLLSTVTRRQNNKPSKQFPSKQKKHYHQNKPRHRISTLKDIHQHDEVNNLKEIREEIKCLGDLIQHGKPLYDKEEKDTIDNNQNPISSTPVMNLNNNTEVQDTSSYRRSKETMLFIVATAIGFVFSLAKNQWTQE